LITVFVHANGRTQVADALDPAWLRPGSEVAVWVDMVAPTPDEARLLAQDFKFHELAVEDALSASHHPKIEAYERYLYLILHGIDFQKSEHCFATHDTDFFLGPTYLVTVHDGGRRSIESVRDACVRNEQMLQQGPAALMHRIIDAMVDHYEPEVDELELEIEELEKEVFERPGSELLRRLLALKRDVSSLRRVVLPQRDVVSRLARREFSLVDEALSYRFRDVYDHLVRLTDQSIALQDRITGLLEAHLSNVSNQLNQVMKVLTVIATIFMPLTVLTSLYGMNVRLPEMPGGERGQFWGVVLMMAVISGWMLWVFRRKRWL
jgi:magnesium transporter